MKLRLFRRQTIVDRQKKRKNWSEGNIEMNFWVVATGLFILVGFSIPAESVEPIRHGPKVWSFLMTDPLLHIGALSLFAVVLGLTSRKRARKRSRAALFFKVALFSALYGLFIELVQAVLPWRFFGMEDLLFDFIGVAAGLVALAVLFLLWESAGNRKTAGEVLQPEKGGGKS